MKNRMNKHIDVALSLVFLSLIPMANMLISHVGTICIPDGPCLIPVGFGLSAPSGVLLVGISLLLRDIIQERLGKNVTLALIVMGCISSFILADQHIALASVLAYGLSELGDFGVYQRVRKHSLLAAMLLSGLFGSIVDSAVFLYIAFGNFDFIAGQVIGKLLMGLLAFAAFPFVRKLT